MGNLWHPDHFSHEADSCRGQPPALTRRGDYAAVRASPERARGPGGWRALARPSARLLPHVPDFLRHGGVRFGWPGDLGTKPMHELFMYDAVHVVLRLGLAQARQDRADLGIVLVVWRTDSDEVHGIRCEDESRHFGVQYPMRLFQRCLPIRATHFPSAERPASPRRIFLWRRLDAFRPSRSTVRSNS